MREEKRTRMVPQEYSVFISKDGVEFPNKHDCEVHEMILDGTAKVCPDCQGKKVREVVPNLEPWNTWVSRGSHKGMRKVFHMQG